MPYPCASDLDNVGTECLLAVADTFILGHKVVREPIELIAKCGKPGMIVNDNGVQLFSIAAYAWIWRGKRQSGIR